MEQRLFTHTHGLGPNLVLLHGWGVNSGVWEEVCKTLCQHFRVTLIDLPGFGRNADFISDEYSLQSLAEQVAECLPEDSILLGWSLGGLVAQQIAIEHGHLLRHLLLVASTPKFSATDSWPGIQPGVLRVFEQQLENDFSKTLDRFLAIQALGSETARHDIKQIKQHIQHFPMPNTCALQMGLKILAEADLRQQLAQILVPTSRIYGRLDSLVPYKVIELIEQLQPESKTLLFAKSSHAPFISHPQEFIAALCEII